MHRQSKIVNIIIIVLILSIGIVLLFSTLQESDSCLGEIAFISNRSGKNEIYLINVGCSEEPYVIKSSCNGSSSAPTWSLDGKQIVYACIEQIAFMPVVSGIHMFDLEANRDTVIIDCHERPCAASRGIMSELQWTHNGACLAWLTKDSLSYFKVERAWSEDGLLQESICGVGETTQPRADYSLVHYYNEPCSPDNKYCLYTHWSADSNYETYLISMSGISSPITADIFHRDVTGLSSTLDISASVLVTDVFHRAAWSPNSDYLALTIFDAEKFTSSLYLVDAGNTEMMQVVNELDVSESRLSWSPDSRKLAFSASQRGDNNWDIYVLDVQTRTVHRITNNAATESSPIWRP